MTGHDRTPGSRGRRASRWGRATLVLACVVASLGTGLGAYVARQQGLIPEHVNSGGLGTARVHVDQHGVPRIVASSMEALFFAQGYVQGRDALFMADVARRIGSGRLAELLGDTQVDQDVLMRAIDIPAIARASIARTSPATLRLCQAYIDGINSHAWNARGALPVEYDVLKLAGLPVGYRVEPFTVEDIMHVILYMSFEFSSNLGFNVGMRDLVNAIGVDAFGEFKRFLKAGDEYNITAESLIIPAGANVAPSWSGVKGSIAAMNTMLTGDEFKGSNAWALAGSRTASGKPILATDPHMKVSTPGLLKSWHLSCPDAGLVLIGAQLPLVPGIFMGRNGHVAWGLTAPFLDCGDAWWETLNGDGTCYLHDGIYHPVATSTVQVRSSSGSIHERTIARVPGHGVLLAIDGKSVSFRWSAMIDERPARNGSAMLDALFGMFQATGAGDVMDVMGDPVHGWDDFPLHAIFTTASGDVGFVAAGRIPVRGNNSTRGVIPLDGSKRENDWTRFTTVGEVSHVVNPPDGMVYAANSKITYPTAGTPPGYLAPGWGNAYRQNRIRDVLAASTGATMEDMRRLQGDLLDYWAPVLIPAITPFLAGLDTPGTAACQHLITWNHTYTRDSIGATVYASFVERYGHAILGDELGVTRDQEDDSNMATVFKHVVHPEILVNLTLACNTTPVVRALFDDITTGEIEDPGMIARRAFVAAVTDLVATLGADPGGWRWSRYNVVEIKHPFNARETSAAILNLGPYEMDGGHAVRMQRGDEGSATRILVEWTSPATTSMVTPPGPAGNPLATSKDAEMVLYVANALNLYLEDVSTMPVIVSVL